MKKIQIVILIAVQISLCFAQKDVLSENDSDDDKTKPVNLDIKTVNSTVLKALDNSTIVANSDDIKNTTFNDTLLLESSSSTTTSSDMLIPPATVEAQIEKLDVTSKKPSRLQVVAAQ